MKPTPLTDAEILHVWGTTENIDHESGAIKLCRAIESDRDAQWVKMLGEQEPVAEVTQRFYDDGSLAGNQLEFVGRNAENDFLLGTKFYTHPAPDHTALLRQALEALENIEGGFGRSRSEFIFSQRCAIDKARSAITAIKEALNVKSK